MLGYAPFLGTARLVNSPAEHAAFHNPPPSMKGGVARPSMGAIGPKPLAFAAGGLLGAGALFGILGLVRGHKDAVYIGGGSALVGAATLGVMYAISREWI